MIDIGWFSTGRGAGSQGLLRFVQDRILAGQLDARIQFVFSNRDPGEAEGSDQFFRLVEGYSLPLITYSSAKFRRAGQGSFASRREEYDGHVMELLAQFHPGICVLAGYMLIVGGNMCRRYDLLNLHPALPDGPTGTWQEVIWKLIETRASRTGAMMHLATEEVDRGPVVSYCTMPITGEGFAPHWRALEQGDLASIKEAQGEDLPLFQQIRQAEYRKEPYLLLETLKAIEQQRVAISNGRVSEGTGSESSLLGPQGICLDPEIECALAADGIAGA